MMVITILFAWGRGNPSKTRCMDFLNVWTTWTPLCCPIVLRLHLTDQLSLVLCDFKGSQWHQRKVETTTWQLVFMYREEQKWPNAAPTWGPTPMKTVFLTCSCDMFFLSIICLFLTLRLQWTEVPSAVAWPTDAVCIIVLVLNSFWWISSGKKWNIAEWGDVGVWAWCMKIDGVLDGIIYEGLCSHPAAQAQQSTTDRAEVSNSNPKGLSGKTNVYLSWTG